jgi:hypothetical protein
MKAAMPLRVIDVEKLGGGIYIQFSNGEAALYTAALLHSLIGEAFVLRGAGTKGALVAEMQADQNSPGKPN